MLAIRLDTAFFGWVLLGERLTSALQWVGMFLVAGEVTASLGIKAGRKKI